MKMLTCGFTVRAQKQITTQDKDNYSIMEISPKTPLEGFIIEDSKHRIVFELYKDINKTYGIFKTTEYDK